MPRDNQDESASHPDCRATGATGDALNVILAAAGHNLRLLLAWLGLLRALIIAAIISTVGSQPSTKTPRYDGV